MPKSMGVKNESCLSALYTENIWSDAKKGISCTFINKSPASKKGTTVIRFIQQTLSQTITISATIINKPFPTFTFNSFQIEF